MYEMSLADLDGELAVELPEREVMQRVRISHSFNRNNVSLVSITAAQYAKAFNMDSDCSTATATNSISVSVSQSS